MIEKHYISYFGLLVIVRSTRNDRTVQFRVAIVHEEGRQGSETGFVLDDPDAHEKTLAIQRASRARRRVRPLV